MEGVNTHHTSCDKCGSSDAVAVYEKEDGKVDGFCWSCDTYIPNPNGESMDKDKSKPSKSNEYTGYEKVEDIEKYQLRELESRGISLDATTKYGVRVGLNPTNGEIESYYFPRHKDNKLSG